MMYYIIFLTSKSNKIAKYPLFNIIGLVLLPAIPGRLMVDYIYCTALLVFLCRYSWVPTGLTVHYVILSRQPKANYSFSVWDGAPSRSSLLIVWLWCGGHADVGRYLRSARNGAWDL